MKMARDPKSQIGDRAKTEDERDGSLDAAEFPIGGAVLSGRREDADDPMTDAQAAELRDLCDKRGEPFDTSLTREQAEARIEALKG